MSQLRIGFNTRVSFTSDDGPAAGLRDGIELFKFAESLGYQSGWAYQRHFDHYLSSPMPFFAAVGQHTSRITLGTAVLPTRYQEPVLLAEAAATTDLLVDGRLQVALSSGGNQFDEVFGLGPTGLTGREEGQRRLAVFLAAIQGDTLHTVTEERLPGPPVGTQLRVTPQSPGLRSRIWYGSGHIDSAVLAAQQGLRLITGTILHSGTGETFSAYQARLIDEYRKAYKDSQGVDAPPVAVSASVLPGTTAELRAKYAAYDEERRTLGPAASRPNGALNPGEPASLPSGFLVSPVFHGTPDQVIEAVLADEGLQAADELVLFLPPAFGLPDNRKLLTDFAQTVAPDLGWAPTDSFDESHPIDKERTR
jgi:alkanesulfonate monooxygenase SsuD/methylene tetrahydromethanopterin reductase-like flavin-dependent oxidoreductase (luciferase family)